MKLIKIRNFSAINNMKISKLSISDLCRRVFHENYFVIEIFRDL